MKITKAETQDRPEGLELVTTVQCLISQALEDEEDLWQSRSLKGRKARHLEK
jgi:hypothetical protein